MSSIGTIVGIGVISVVGALVFAIADEIRRALSIEIEGFKLLRFACVIFAIGWFGAHGFTIMTSMPPPLSIVEQMNAPAPTP